MNDLTKSEHFHKYGYVYLENIISKETCTDFTQLMLNKREKNNLQYEKKVNAGFYNESYGGSDEVFHQLTRDLTPRLEEELNVKMVPSGAYGRIYYNGGTLARHVDRPSLDYTISISLFSNLKTPWPLICEDRLGNIVPLNIGIGDGGMMFGAEMNHWRDDLICGPDEYIVQLFLHWAFPTT